MNGQMVYLYSDTCDCNLVIVLSNLNNKWQTFKCAHNRLLNCISHNIIKSS